MALMKGRGDRGSSDAADAGASQVQPLGQDNPLKKKMAADLVFLPENSVAREA